MLDNLQENAFNVIQNKYPIRYIEDITKFMSHGQLYVLERIFEGSGSKLYVPHAVTKRLVVCGDFKFFLYGFIIGRIKR